LTLFVAGFGIGMWGWLALRRGEEHIVRGLASAAATFLALGVAIPFGVGVIGPVAALGVTTAWRGGRQSSDWLLLAVVTVAAGVALSGESRELANFIANLLSTLLAGAAGWLLVRRGIARGETHEAMLESLPLGIYRTTVGGRFLAVNTAFAAMLKSTPDEVLRRSAVDLHVSPEARESWTAQVEERGRLVGHEIRLRCPDGTFVWVRESVTAARDGHGRIVYFDGVCEDITSERDVREQLNREALRDPLTGLANRRYLLEQMRLRRAAAHDQTMSALLFIDVDDFKLINDTLGHSAGDKVLRLVAHRLQAAIRQGDTVARLGGDEFAVLMDGLPDSGVARSVANRLMTAFDAPFAVDERELQVTASAGLAFADSEPEVWLGNADMAMYSAKAQGRGSWRVFEPALREDWQRQVELTSDLRVAIGLHQVVPHYQPIVDLASGRLVAVEALARWTHPDRGAITPDTFIPIAERAGLIVSLGADLLALSCQQLRAWQDRSDLTAPDYVSVNVSSHQLSDSSFVATVERALVANQLRPTQLCLEINGATLLRDTPAIQDTINQLNAIGVQLVLDDFGVGYAGLDYFRRYALDGLKIDRSFVAGIDDTREQAAIVSAALGLAQSLGMVVTGEGVERWQQLVQLRALGCDLGQGYWIARPQEAVALEALLTHAGRTTLAHAVLNGDVN
jgi:diguanylate cyclase (GGDEF)-like protein/PAS domain S-box-containing protein